MDAAAKECLENTEQEQQQQESEVLKELLPREQQLDPMSECDTLAPSGRGILNYQSMESGEPRQINDEEVEEPDSLSVRDPRAKKHRRKRTRYVSQGSTTPGGRRLTITGRTPRKARRRHGPTAPPRHVHCNDWREMLNITRQKDEIARFALENEMESFGGEVEELRAVEAGSDANENGPVYPPPAPVQHATTNSNREKEATRARYISGGSSVQCDWIEETFCKRECCQFIASSRDTNKCYCGLYKNQHSKQALDHPVEPFEKRSKRGGFERWSIQRHTVLAPTDAYGTIEFQGGPHPFKAQYLRLSFDSDPADIMCLFERVWQLDPPKLIITVHGGMTNFDLQPKLARVFRKGLLKAARTTGAWIFTSGIDAGVMRQVSAALESAVPTSRMHNKIVSVGIAPWGLVKRREDFIGRDKVVLYHPQSFPPKTRFAVLNNRHSYFLLVDNGCVGRYGADIILRRRFESYIAEKQKICGGTRSVPVVCVVLEGGTCTIRTVLDYVTTLPKVPVVICDGSGRASDLLAFAHQYIQEDGNLPEGIRPQLLSLIEDVFFYDKHNAQCLVMDILACVRQRNLITVFRLGENQKHDVDYAILTALLKGHNLSAAEQLSLALAWNRVDIARSDIFVMGQDWPKAALHNAMLEALIHNRVDFVRLLLENGVSMHDFLTIARLEELYNTDQGPPNTLYYIVRDVVKIRAGYRYRLPHIGMAIEKLMTNGFRSHYTSAQFRDKYSEYRNKLKEAQRRMHSQASDEQVPTSPSNYHRTGSEFFSRGFFRNLPPSASDTRLGESVPKAHETAGNGPQPKVSVIGGAPPLRHNLTMQPQANSFATGSRALSNHILWRTAYRRDVNHPTGGKQSSRTPPPFNRDGLTEAVEYAMEVDDKQHGEQEHHESDFRYPFSDLLVWAVLTKRHEMALCMWQHGEEAMAKALVACRLYKSLAKEAAEDYLEVEVCEELKKYADEFRQLSLDLLDYCYKQDDAQTLQLLTYELTYWGHETCLSLAVIVNNKQFLAHPCCQILLADLWHGGLRIRSNSNLKVIMGILFAPSIFLLEFKSREELMLQPQTAAEHQNDINDTSSSSSESSSSSSSSESETDDEREKNDESDVGDKGAALGDRRRISHGSMQSLNFASIFQSKRRRHKASQYASSAGANANREDIEMGKQRNREPNHEAKDTSRSRSLATQGYKDRVEARGGAVRDLVAQSTLGAAISAASSAGGSPLMVHQLPTTGLTPPESFSSFRPSPTSSPTVATRAQQSLGVENSIKSQSEAVYKKSAPHFVLGSIGENVADSNNEEGYISTVSSPRNQRANNHITTPAASPRQRQENSKRPGSPPHYGSPTRWDLARSGGLAKAIDQLGRLTHIGGEQVPKGIPLPEGVTLNKKRQIKFRRKLYEFFVAPITTFWAWALSFLVFLSILTYVLLIRTPSKPTYLEWYLFAYVIAFGLEIVRKFFMSEPKKIKEKFEYFFGNYWNFITSLAIIVFIIGFGFRLHTPTSKSIGRIILAVDSVLWSIKLLDFLGVHPRFGPYITMAGKMVMNMSSIVVMLGISLLGFGLARQSITYPNEEWHWLLLRNVFYKPYFMLYGEVYADEIDTCGDEAWDEHLDKNISISNAWTHRDDRARELACVPGHWIPPILMTVFLLIANILLISMLIAIFNNIFESTNKISQQIWLFQRYRQVMEYEATPFLPPPFTPVYHLYMFFKYLNYRSHPCACFRSITRNLCFACCARGQSDKDSACEECADGRKVPNQLPKNAYEQRRNLGNGSGNHKEGLALFDFSLKLFLSDDQVEKLHDFEEECMEDLAREKEYERNRTAEERLHRTCERTELILLRVNDLASKETMLKGNVRELETRLDLMESRQSEMLDCLRQIGTALPALVQSIQSLQQQVAGVGPPGLVRTDSVTPLAMPDEPPDQREERAGGRYLVAHSEGQLALQDAEQMRPGKSTSAILPAAARDKRAQSAQSHALEQDVPGSTVSSSMSTVYYPLKGGTQQGSGSNLHGADQSNAAAAHHHHQRTRTTTITGNEYPSSSHSGAGNDVGLTPSGRQKRLFGSMASLEPSGMAAGPTSKKMSSLQPKKSMSTKRRHRQNDEYTSITDAISIEYEEASMSIQIPTFSSQLEAETEEGENANDGEEKSTQQQRELAVDAGLQTEEEEEDEEEYMEEEDEDEDEEDEELLDEEAGRSPKRMSRERAGRKAGVQIDIEIDTASLCFDGDEDGDRISSRRARPFSELMDDAEMEEGFPRVATPNSTLRRARSSFVQRQNTLFKSYEEAVGRPSYEMQGTSAEAVKKRKSVSEAEQLAPEGQGKAGEPGKGDASSNSSKEFITFGAAQDGEPQEQK